MGKLKWYKRDPDAALGGMMDLTLEERGAYNTVLDLIYARSDNLPDDDRFIAGWCNCDVRVWRRIKTRLLELGKLHVDNGLLRNTRATSGVDDALHRVEVATRAALFKHGKPLPEPRQRNGLARAGAAISQVLTTTTSRFHEGGPEEKKADAPARGAALAVGSTPRAKRDLKAELERLAAAHRNKLQ